MIPRLPRILTVPLPEGQDWTIRRIGDETVIVVSEDLDDDEQKAAQRAAYASMRRRHLVWMPLPAAVVGGWLSRRACSLLGAATVASLATAAAVLYGAIAKTPERRPAADPPELITLTPMPTVISPTATTTPAPDLIGQIRTATPVRASSTRGPTQPPPTVRGTPAPSTETSPTTTDTPDETAVPTSDPPTEPPSLTPTPSTSGDDDDDGNDDDDGDDGSGGGNAPPGCGGIRLRVPLDPLLGLDACLLS